MEPRTDFPDTESLLSKKTSSLYYGEEEDEANIDHRQLVTDRRRSWLMFILGLVLGIFLSTGLIQALQLTPQGTYTPAPKLKTVFKPLVDAESPKALQGLGPFIAPLEDGDAAWTHMVQPVQMRASREELQRAGADPDDSIEFVDGGYLSTTAMYHDLHCLRRLRLWVFKDIVYPNMTETGHVSEQGHLSHCLEALRQSTVCKGDTGFYTYKWVSKGKTMAKSASQRACVDFDALDFWARQRQVGFDPPLRPPKSAA